MSHEGACRPSASSRGACRPRDAQTHAYRVQGAEPAARAKIGERACRLAQTNTTTKREGACRPLRILAPLGARRPGFEAPSYIISMPQSKNTTAQRTSPESCVRSARVTQERESASSAPAHSNKDASSLQQTISHEIRTCSMHAALQCLWIAHVGHAHCLSRMH